MRSGAKWAVVLLFGSAACFPSFDTQECYSDRDCPLDQLCDRTAHACALRPDTGEGPDLGEPDLGEPDGGIDDGGIGDVPVIGVLHGTWRQLAFADQPSPREGAAIAYSPFDRALILAGGCDTDPVACNETWSWSGAAWMKLMPANDFGARKDAVLFESELGPLVLFGGRDPATGDALEDTLTFTSESWSALPQSSPPRPRFSAAAVYDPLHRIAVMFGGFTCPIEQVGCEALADTCFFEARQWRCAELEGPNGRGEHAMFFDAARGVVVMTGGRASGALLDETWTFDGAQWRQSSAMVFARAGAALAYDSIRGVAVLEGGEVSTFLSDDTWELHGGDWFSVDTSSTPPARTKAALGYDSGSGQLILFGGRGAQGFLGDIWEYLGAN